MKDPNRWLAVAIVVCGLAAGFYFWLWGAKEAPPIQPVARPEAAPKPEAKPEPQIQFPVPQAGDAPSLPALDQSDVALRDALASLVGQKNLEQLFNLQNLVRRIVATVDNLPREKLAQRLMPLKPTSGPFLVSGDGEDRTISAQNATRYRPFVAVAESVDAAKLVAAYVRYYPLFQQAYRELGYPQGYFNDRLVLVIDHLLEAPEIKGPVKLAQRKVLYEFADAELESRSAGQKILMRIGPENAARLKAKLRGIRRELIGQPPKP
jgi:flagellar basal body-associated protein FliL